MTFHKYQILIIFCVAVGVLFCEAPLVMSRYGYEGPARETEQRLSTMLKILNKGDKEQLEVYIREEYGDRAEDILRDLQIEFRDEESLKSTIRYLQKELITALGRPSDAQARKRHLWALFFAAAGAGLFFVLRLREKQ